jgi:hypothetical protein
MTRVMVCIVKETTPVRPGFAEAEQKKTLVLRLPERWRVLADASEVGPDQAAVQVSYRGTRYRIAVEGGLCAVGEQLGDLIVRQAPVPVATAHE